MGRRVIEEYSQLLARAFNGAITVNGQRIVAHPSGTLIVRGSEPRPVTTITRPVDPEGQSESGPLHDWRENDWSDV
ncbi:MAG TPA: hypothetical protein VIV11_04970 [Kofleriaceae bacterium]